MDELVVTEQKTCHLQRRWCSLRLLLAGLAAALALLLPGPWSRPLPVRTIWTLQAEMPFILSAFADEAETRVRVRGDGQIQELELPLAQVAAERLRFKWGSELQRVAVRKMVVKGLFRSRAFSGRDLSRLFVAQGALAIRPLKGEGIALDIRSGEVPLLMARPELLQWLQEDRADRLLLAILSWSVLSVLFFLLFSLSRRDGWGALNRKTLRYAAALLLLVLMSFSIWIKWPLRPIDERRVLAAVPQFRLDECLDWGGQIEAFLSDHQRLRPLLIRLYNRIVIDILKTSPGEGVLLGRRNWLFMGRERADLDARRGYRGLDPFNETELNDWVELLVQRKEWLAQKGIGYRFLVVPNKATIYPEFLPDFYRRLNRPSRLDQLADRLVSRGETILLDIRTTLVQAKEQSWPVFHSSDSHWSAYGAYAAAAQMLKGLGAAQPMTPVSEYEIYAGPRFGGDLAIALGLEMDRFSEKSWVRMSRKKAAASPDPVWEALPDLGPFVRQQRSHHPGISSGRLLLVHDSFAHELAPVLADHLQSVHLIWDWGLGFYPQQIEDFGPDWVVDEMAERYLYGPLPRNPDGMALGYSP